MSAVLNVYAKDEILKSFNTLVLQYRRDRLQLVTKSAEAEKKHERELVKTASQTTVPTIVNGIAELQLNFGSTLSELSEQLIQENKRLGELQQAIEVEQETLEQLHKIKISAEAFDILKHDHRQLLAALIESHKKAHDALIKEQAHTQALWHKQAQAILDEQETYQAARLKLTNLREEEYHYEQARKIKLAQDQFAANKAALEYQLKEQGLAKQKEWDNHRKALTKQAPQLAKGQDKLKGFEEKVKEDATKAREKAIQKVQREAKVDAELWEKDHQASIEVYELTIANLEATIADNLKQISDLTTQLNAALERAQSLAANAVART